MEYTEYYNHWVNSNRIDETTRRELESIRENEEEIKERFFQELAFGTGGLRGVIGAGINRINKYIVRKATQGYAEYIKKAGIDACRRGVVIAHDNRLFSKEFCYETAGVLAANGIHAYIFASLRTTPELSYAVRYLGAFGGVVITASHNPPEYNGYKLYDERGCQFVPQMTDAVFAEIKKISDSLSVKAMTFEAAGDLITVLGDEVDESYYRAVMSVSLCPNVKKDIKIVYSPQHGTGNIPVRTILGRLGYDVTAVLEQCDPDPAFSNTQNPNPENAGAYVLAIEYAKKHDADIVITTDPDCDRLGVAVKRGDEFIRMTGNQSAAVLLEYILSNRKAQGTLPQNGVMLNTVVTSDIGDKICADYGISTEKTLTGFKFIGDKIYQHELAHDKTFVFGYEESYGCLIADFVRDKDAVQASVMLCEAVAYYKEQGKTLLNVLDELFTKYGYFIDGIDNFAFKGVDIQRKATALMDELRKKPPKTVAGIDIVEIQDFESDDMRQKGFPKSNVLKFIFADGSWVATRPSGTEPKCKFYYNVVADNASKAQSKLDAIRKAFGNYTQRLSE